MSYTITAKNITKLESEEVYSDEFIEILKILDEHEKSVSKFKKDIEFRPSRTAKQLHRAEGLVPQHSIEEYAYHVRKDEKDNLKDHYDIYVRNYYNSLEALSEIKEILEENPNHKFYYRVCPVTGKKFQIMTDKEIGESIRGFRTSSWGNKKKRAYQGLFSIVKKESSGNDDLEVRDRYHPSVVDKIKEQWNFTNPIVVDKDTEDGTPIELNIESGKIQVAYNPHKSINHLSIQHLKLYPNTKGIHYRIRGSKRVYLDLVDIKLQR